MTDSKPSFADAATIEEVVYQAVGAGSVCWDGVPHGVFRDDRARAIAEAATACIGVLLGVDRRNTLAQNIAHVINAHSRENASNTPDFLLAEYLVRCLEAFEIASRRREEWYGTPLTIGVTATTAVGVDTVNSA